MEAAHFDGFPHRPATEDHRLDREESSTVAKLHIDLAAQVRTVEQDGLLRQPVQPSLVTDAKVRGDLGRSAIAAVDLLAGLRRHHRPGARPEFHVKRELIAAG